MMCLPGVMDWQALEVIKDSRADWTKIKNVLGDARHSNDMHVMT